eukprot:COSAG01_NODE_311_length_19072_cov_73.511727_9_plen_205_part_00
MPRTDSAAAGQQLLVDTATAEDGSSSDHHRMQIFVKTTTGRTIILRACGSDTGAVIKSRIQTAEGVPPNQQSLFFGKRELEDERTLDDCGVCKEGTLRLVLTQAGASMRSGRSDATAVMLGGFLDDQAAAPASFGSGAHTMKTMGCSRGGRLWMIGLAAILGVAVLCLVVALGSTGSDQSRAWRSARPADYQNRATRTATPSWG